MSGCSSRSSAPRRPPTAAVRRFSWTRRGAGDEHAWGELVSRHAELLWSIARSSGLDRAAAEEVVRTVWLRLLEHDHPIREPSTVTAWLIATASRECLGAPRPRSAADDLPPEPVWAADRLLWQGFRLLPERDARLLALLARGVAYDEVAAALRIPRDRIDRTKTRALRELRTQLARAGEHDRAAADSRTG